MKVFGITPTEPHTGGSAYVAANDIEEAINTFREDDYRNYKYDYGNCICNRIDKISYDTNKPFVIFDDLWLD